MNGRVVLLSSLLSLGLVACGGGGSSDPDDTPTPSGENTSSQTNTPPEVAVIYTGGLAIGESIQLGQGVFSDADGDVLTYSWEITDDGGTGANLSSSVNALTTLSVPRDFSIDSQRTVKLNVSANDGQETTTKEWSVYVYPARQLEGVLTEDLIFLNYETAYLTGDLTIPAGISLIAGEGVTIYGSNSADLIVEGTLEVEGHPSSSAKLVSDPESPLLYPWTGINVVNEGSISLSYAEIEGGFNCIDIDGASSVTLGYLHVSNCFYGFNWVDFGNPKGGTLSYFTFDNNVMAISGSFKDSTNIENNKFYNNDLAFSFLGNDGDPVIRNNSFVNNEQVVRAPLALGDYRVVDMSQNWWGADSEGVAEVYVEDMQDDAGLFDINVSPVLSTEPDNIGFDSNV